MTRDADPFAMARAHHQAGRLAEAEALYRRILAADPGHLAALHYFGIVALDTKRPDLARELCGRAAAAAPDEPSVHNNLGNALMQAGLAEQAIEAFRTALRLAPGIASIHFNLGRALKALDRPEEAVAAFRAAIRLKPDHAEAYSTLGNTLAVLDRGQEAIAAYRQALAIRPGYAEAYVNLGCIHAKAGRLDDAQAFYRHALTLAPQLAEAHTNLADSLLLGGDYAAGWTENEWRFNPDKPGRPFPQPRWRGEDLDGRRLLVWGEQGIGDELTFFAILPELVAGGAQVVVECDPRLVPLLGRSLPGIEAVARTDPPQARLLADDIDVQVPVVSAVALLRPSLSGFRPLPPYLTADAAVAADFRRAYGPGPLVGISWWTRHPKLERSFSIPLADWRPILDVPGFRFVSLQYGAGRAEIAAAGFDLIDDITVDPLTDIDRFAAQVAAMDLVISVDNSTVSMACALGRPVWDLLAFAPDWRMGLDGAASPWYHGMRLFRQRAPGAWGPVVAEVAAALGGRTAGGRERDEP